MPEARLDSSGDQSRGLLALLRALRRPAQSSTTIFQASSFGLENIESAVPLVSSEIGRRYLKSGASLEPLSLASAAVREHSGTLLRLAVGQTEGDLVVERTTDVLSTPFRYLDRWRTEVQRHVAELVACQDVFTRLLASESTLKQLVSPLTHIQTMFRIESAKLPEEVRQVFAGLTAQIAAVHAEVSSTFAQQFQIVSTTLGTLSQVGAGIGTKAEHIRENLAERKHRIDQSLSKLRAELARNGTRESELNRTSFTVTEAISGIIVCLQAHDVCAQWLEGVRLALAQARELAGRGKYQQAFYIFTIQKAQVQGVQEHLEKNEATLARITKEVLERVSAFDHKCVLLQDFEEVTVATNGSVELSLEMMQDIQNLLEASVESSREFHASVKPLGGLTASLTGALESLSNKMRLIALNAQVQAVHIGSGTGLEILAAHTAHVSAETSGMADSVTSDIRRLIQIVENLSASFEQIASDGVTELADLRTNRATHETTLHELRDRTLAELRLLGDAVDQISKQTSAVAEESTVREAAIAPLVGFVSQLDFAVAQMSKRGGSFNPEVVRDLKLPRYIMQSQRDVHNRVSRELGVSASELAAVETEAESESLVELF